MKYQDSEDYLFKSVQLIHNNESGVPLGAIGTILEIYNDMYCEVEFVNEDASTLYLGSVRYEDLEILD